MPENVFVTSCIHLIKVYHELPHNSSTCKALQWLGDRNKVNDNPILYLKINKDNQKISNKLLKHHVCTSGDCSKLHA